MWRVKRLRLRGGGTLKALLEPFLNGKHKGFTLAEMMVVMLILSIVLAAMAPVVTTRSKVDQSSPWRYSEANLSDAYYGMGPVQTAMIGQNDYEDTDEPVKLIINSFSRAHKDHISFKVDGVNKGLLSLNNDSILLGSVSNGSAIGTNTVNVGTDTKPDGSNSIAIGNSAESTKKYSTAVGSNAKAVSDYSTAIGANSNASGYLSIAVGEYAQATGFASIALGQTHDVSGYINENYATQARNRWSIAIGPWAVAGIKGEDPVNGASFQTALGPYSAAIGNGSLALGGANAIPQWSIAIGSAKVGEGDGLNPVLDSGGEYGIAIGRSAATTGDQGISIGNNAAVTSTGSVAIGANTRADTGTVAIGYNALSSSSNADYAYNTAIGYESMKSTTSGIQNTAIGRSTLAQNTSGTQNVAIGNNTMPSNTTGTVNTAVGPNSMTANTEGSYNSALGYAALDTNKTGSNNTGIGYKACYNVTGSNKTCIGANSGPSSSSDWAKDDVERVFIGGKPKFNDGVAVLEVHNDSKKRVYRDGKSHVDSTVVVNGNLLVKGFVFSTLWSKGERDILAFYGHDGDQMEYFNVSRDSGSLMRYYGESGHGYYKNAEEGSFNVSSWGWSSGSSDKRLKYINGENTSGLDKIRQLKVFNYTFKKDKTKTPHVGVIAQDLQKIFPDAVKKGKNGFLTIRLEDMFYAVINAIKELDARVTALEKENAELKARLDKIEAKLK